MTSAENSVSEPPNLENFLGEETPTPRYKARAFGTSDNASPPPPPPRQKQPSCGPEIKLMLLLSRFTYV